jgi:hypothetical protein
MAKTFGELKAGDTIYWMSVYTISAGAKKGNCAMAYKKLEKVALIETYPAMSNISEFKVFKVEEITGIHFGQTELIVYYNNGALQTYKILDKTSTTEVSSFLINSYHIYSTNKTDIILKAREIIQALMEINRNNMIERDKCYKEMLSKLNSGL